MSGRASKGGLDEKGMDRMRTPPVVNVTLTIDESAAIVLSLRGDPLGEGFRKHAVTAREKVERAAKAAQMGTLTAPGPTLESAVRAACGDAP